MKESGMGGSKPKKKASSLSASKVSPKVINQIKTLGMTKALASAKSNKGNKAYMAGLTRMYGAKRVNAALGYKAGAGASRPVGGVMGSSKYKNVMGGSSSTVKKTVAPKKKSVGQPVRKMKPSSLRGFLNRKVPKYTE
jgi:hypothetical protein